MKKPTTQLAQAFLKNHTTTDMSDFLMALLTPKEMVELSTRLNIVKMLKQGTAQHKIAEKLGVGVATVTRGSKELQQGRFKNV